jgi:hypothetical protein
VPVTNPHASVTTPGVIREPLGVSEIAEKEGDLANSARTRITGRCHDEPISSLIAEQDATGLSTIA